MKMLVLLMIFSCCSLFGIWIDQDERKRIKEIETFIYLFEMLKGEIDYQLTPLMAACNKVASYAKGAVSDTFYDFSRRLGEGEAQELKSIWDETLAKSKGCLHLKEADYVLLETFCGSDGELDKNMQKRQIEILLNKLEHARKVSEEKYERCAKLNRYLGVLVGAALVIFLI